MTLSIIATRPYGTYPVVAAGESLSLDATSIDQIAFENLIRAIRSLGAELAPMLEEEYRRSRTSAGKGMLVDLIDPTAAYQVPEATPPEEGGPDEHRKAGKTPKQGARRKKSGKSAKKAE